MRSLLFVAGVLGACSSPPPEQRCIFSTGQSTVYVVDSVTVPMSSNDFAYDLNGDGHTDNRMGNILGALIQNGWDPQSAVNASLKSGMFSPFFEMTTGGDNDTRAAIVGDDDPTLKRSLFCLTPAQGTSESPQPIELTHVSTLTLRLPFLDNAVADATAVHLRVQDRYGGGFTGQLNVALSKNTVDTVVIPALGRTLTSRTAASVTIQSLFDTGGTDDGSGCMLTANTCSGAQPAGTAACRNPTYGDRPSMCADQCDNIIDTCEVSTNSLVKNCSRRTSSCSPPTA